MNDAERPTDALLVLKSIRDPKSFTPIAADPYTLEVTSAGVFIISGLSMSKDSVAR
jgi:hypothetical protein